LPTDKEDAMQNAPEASLQKIYWFVVWEIWVEPYKHPHESTAGIFAN